MQVDPSISVHGLAAITTGGACFGFGAACRLVLELHKGCGSARAPGAKLVAQPCLTKDLASSAPPQALSAPFQLAGRLPAGHSRSQEWSSPESSVSKLGQEWRFVRLPSVAAAATPVQQAALLPKEDTLMHRTAL